MNQILPQSIDNTYRGHPLALWLLIPVVILKTGIALGTIFNGRGAAQSADGIPLDSFGAGGAEAVVALFAIWGLSQLVFSVLGILALPPAAAAPGGARRVRHPHRDGVRHRPPRPLRRGVPADVWRVALRNPRTRARGGTAPPRRTARATAGCRVAAAAGGHPQRRAAPRRLTPARPTITRPQHLRSTPRTPSCRLPSLAFPARQSSRSPSSRRRRRRPTTTSPAAASGAVTTRAASASPVT